MMDVAQQAGALDDTAGIDGDDHSLLIPTDNTAAAAAAAGTGRLVTSSAGDSSEVPADELEPEPEPAAARADHASSHTVRTGRSAPSL
jgi:hypothetical protein|eukprot:COSAG01_NODE_3447_length_6079_cov_12.927343_10_plen_88_part_00